MPISCTITKSCRDSTSRTSSSTRRIGCCECSTAKVRMCWAEASEFLWAVQSHSNVRRSLKKASAGSGRRQRNSTSALTKSSPDSAVTTGQARDVTTSGGKLWIRTFFQPTASTSAKNVVSGMAVDWQRTLIGNWSKDLLDLHLLSPEISGMWQNRAFFLKLGKFF